jgi:outer membrane biosynthesis protein TonB
MSQAATQIDIGGSRRPDRRVDPEGVGVGMLTSIMLHGGIIGLMVLATMWSEADIRQEQQDKKIEFEDVKLLKLGEQKPKNELPRIANPAPSQAQEETVALNQKEPKEPEKEQPKDPTPAKEKQKDPEPSEAEPRDSDRQKEMAEAFESLSNPNRPTNEVVPEGSKKGVKEGTVSDEALANMMRTYSSRLIRTIIEVWQVPTTLSGDELKKLAGKVVVHVRLSEQGHVVTYRFLERSGNEQFDSSIERVLRRFQVTGGGKTLPMPDNEQARRSVIKRGLDLQKWQLVTQ